MANVADSRVSEELADVLCKIVAFRPNPICGNVRPPCVLRVPRICLLAARTLLQSTLIACRSGHWQLTFQLESTTCGSCLHVALVRHC